MYAAVLLPILLPLRRPKILEIGLGCTMGMGARPDQGAGAGVQLLRRLFPRAELWSAERDGKCVEKHQREGRLPGINPLIGDQGDPAALRRWISQSGGGFNAIIDDGSHMNADILASFTALWPHLSPGGVYIITDLGVSRFSLFAGSNGSLFVSDVIQGWLELLLVNAGDDPTFAERRARLASHPKLPEDLAFISCQYALCALVRSRRRWKESPPASKCKTTACRLLRIVDKSFDSRGSFIVGY